MNSRLHRESSKIIWVIFLAMGIAVFIVDVDMTAINMAMTHISQELILNLPASQWVINGYLIAAASLMTFAGRASDIYGVRRIFVIGMAAFTVSSLAVALSINAYSICIARFLQGACMAFIFPLSIIIARNAFPNERQGFVMGMLISIAGISQAIGPSLAGLIVYVTSWRMIFLINIPLGIIVIAIVLYCVEENKTPLIRKQLDGFSVILFVGALMLLMYVINNMHSIQLSTPSLAVCLFLSFSMLAVFLWLESRSHCPLLEKSLFKNHNFLILNGIRSVTQMSYFGILFMMGLLLETSLNLNIFQTSAIMSALTLTFGISSLFTGQLADKYGNLPLMTSGLGLMLLGYVDLASLGISDGSLWMITSALMLIGTASALLLPALTNSIAMSVPQQQIGAAMGLYFSNGYFSASMGVGLSGYFVTVPNTKVAFIDTFSQFMWLCSGMLLIVLTIVILCPQKRGRLTLLQ